MLHRTLLAIAALALIAWLAAPAISAQPHVPKAVDFDHAVPEAEGARAAAKGDEITLPVVRPPGRFDLVGLRWSDGRDLEIDLRVRRDGGSWSRWVHVGSADAAQGRSDPVWTGGADAYQLRLNRRPAGLRAHFVNATGTRTKRERAGTVVRRSVRAAVMAVLPAPSARAQSTTTGAPSMVSRDAWEGGQCRPRRAASRGRVDFGMVHHTVSTNAYGPEASPAMVLAICRYHRNSNGWDDIGYNFLVDRYGRVFEGRAGGIDQPISGAHAQGYNGSSTGVANLGTFSGVPQTPAGIRSTARLLAWKLNLHGAPVSGPVTVRSAGGGTNRYPAGRNVTFQRISGHRDGNNTECPGGALFAQVPEIRRQAVEHAATLPPPSPGGGAAPPPAAGDRFPAKLQVSRAGVVARSQRLDVLAPITRRATGPVDVTLKAAGRSLLFREQVDSAKGRLRFQRAIARAQARLGTGIVTLRYPGNARTRGQEVRLRAASRRAELQVVRPTLEDGRVRAQGTISSRARGVVRVQLDWVSGGQPRVLELRAPVQGGRWTLDQPLSPAIAQSIADRQGSLHSYVLFTGYLPQRMRGEMRSLQVLGDPPRR
jgi:hypothetical protein